MGLNSKLRSPKFEEKREREVRKGEVQVRSWLKQIPCLPGIGDKIMQTISSEMDVVAQAGLGRGRPGIARDHGRRYYRALPVVPGLPAATCKMEAAPKVARSIWIAPEKDSRFEGMLMFALCAGAVVGVVRGVSLLFDYVQNSEAIHQIMARLLL